MSKDHGILFFNTIKSVTIDIHLGMVGGFFFFNDFVLVLPLCDIVIAVHLQTKRSPEEEFPPVYSLFGPVLKVVFRYITLSGGGGRIVL